jgi:2'-5' RNA ligase superfamily
MSNLKQRKHTCRDLVAVETRIQLSLYVPSPSAVTLEEARRLLDPIQAKLIPAHVTLCREDELNDFELATLGPIIDASGVGPITLKFAGPEIFQGHGVLLPCIGGDEEFHELRCRLLGSRTVRRHAPHITIAHPRNPRSAQNQPRNLSALQTDLVIRFTEVSHILQEAAMPWQVIAKHPLREAAHSDA